MHRSLAQLRQDAAAIFNAAVKAVDPAEAVERHVRVTPSAIEAGGRSYSRAEIRNIYVIGAGKASVPMARAVEGLLGEQLNGGVVVTKYGQAQSLRKVSVVEAAHPIPDDSGLNGAREVATIAAQADANDLIFFLLSGGGSALMPYPISGLTLTEKQAMTQLLLRSGATIRETNALRRHLSQLKGGKLARLAYPARTVTLIISDVVGDSLEDIASGPTAPDPSRYADCWQIIHKYHLDESLPGTVRSILDRGLRGEIAETAKADDMVFGNVQNCIIASNRLATAAAKAHAEAMGYRCEILSNEIEGESREVARQQMAKFKNTLRSPRPQPICFIAGGETTVTVRGDGMGGRNQEFALAAAIELAGVEGTVVLSAGTDGIDGPTDAAGAIVDGATVARGRSQRCDAAEFLARNDAYHFLQATDDLLISGPTHTNVMDIQLLLAA
jgi:glycerate 2-kinase